MSGKDEYINEKPYPENTEGEWGARFLCPLASSAHIAHIMESPTHISQAELAYGMERLVEALNNNDVQAVQEILLPQAVALQVIFEKASRRMINAEYINGLQAWATIAFKAQEQSRKTISTLMAIRQPRNVAFIKQQNNAVNQQVNNIELGSGHENPGSLSNELLSGGRYEALDSRGTPQTIRSNIGMEAMAEINRRKD